MAGRTVWGREGENCMLSGGEEVGEGTARNEVRVGSEL